MYYDSKFSTFLFSTIFIIFLIFIFKLNKNMENNINI